MPLTAWQQHSGCVDGLDVQDGVTAVRTKGCLGHLS